MRLLFHAVFLAGLNLFLLCFYPIKLSYKMLLISILNIEVTVLRWLGVLGFFRTRDKKFFYFNRRLFITQIVIMTVIGLVTVDFQKYLAESMAHWDQQSKKLSSTTHIIDKNTETGSTVVAIALLYIFAIGDAYSWFVIFMNRLCSCKRFGEVYNDLLAIDYDIRELEPETTYVVEFWKKRYLWRMTVFMVFDLYQTIEDFTPFVPEYALITKFSIIIQRSTRNFIFNQLLTIFHVLASQAEALGQVAEAIDSEEKLYKTRLILIKIIRSGRRANKTFGLQMLMTLTSVTIFILFNLYSITSTIGLVGFNLYDYGFMRKIEVTFVSGFILFAVVYVLANLKSSVQSTLIKFQDATDRLGVQSNVCLLARRGFIQNLTFSLKNYTNIDDMKFIFGVICEHLFFLQFRLTALKTVFLSFQILSSLVSYLVIALQFQQIAIDLSAKHANLSMVTKASEDFLI